MLSSASLGTTRVIFPRMRNVPSMTSFIVGSTKKGLSAVSTNRWGPHFGNQVFGTGSSYRVANTLDLPDKQTCLVSLLTSGLLIALALPTPSTIGSRRPRLRVEDLRQLPEVRGMCSGQ